MKAPKRFIEMITEDCQYPMPHNYYKVNVSGVIRGFDELSDDYALTNAREMVEEVTARWTKYGNEFEIIGEF